MSNIPNSAMPHAWAHDDDEDNEARRTSANQMGFSLTTAAVVAGVAALFLWLRRK